MKRTLLTAIAGLLVGASCFSKDWRPDPKFEALIEDYDVKQHIPKANMGDTYDFWNAVGLSSDRIQRMFDANTKRRKNVDTAKAHVDYEVMQSKPYLDQLLPDERYLALTDSVMSLFWVKSFFPAGRIMIFDDPSLEAFTTADNRIFIS